MTKNPIVNALTAVLYICAVVSMMYFGSSLAAPMEKTLLLPIVMLCLFSLSVVVMACVFFYQPVLMYMEGEKARAIKLGLQTVGAFAVVTAVLLASIIVLSTFL